jgi:hypothetical protein
MTFVEEAPGGIIDGVNNTFILSNVPIIDTLRLFLWGQKLIRGTDFSQSSTTITMTTIPKTGDSLIALYKY